MVSEGSPARLRHIDATLGMIRDRAEVPMPPPAAEPTSPVRPVPAVLTQAGRHGACSGQTWDDFAIGDLLGQGGMGEVYLACQRSVGREVAFKVLRATSGDDAEHRRRFSDEVRAAGRLRSPHAVAVIASGTHGGTPWLAMEYVRGTSLAQVLIERRRIAAPLPPRETLDLIRQAAQGLADAHRQQLVHRDLKPANLLLADNGTLKIADFGLVRFLDTRTLTAAGTVLGTPRYAAPEQLRGLSTDARSDLYSLGVVFYELLTLHPPFDGDTAEALIFQHNFAEPPLPTSLNADVPQDLQAVCLKCLQKDPARRFADATALLGDLGRLREGLAPQSAVFAPGKIDTGAEEALRRLAPWRQRWWPILSGGTVLLLALALSWWWWDARKAEISGLRDRLLPLTQIAAVPATAGDDLRRLGILVSNQDAQVVHGQAKLSRISQLSERLEIFSTLASPAGGDRIAAARADLTALAEEVGPAGDSRMGRWAQAIATADGLLATLRQRLAPLLAEQKLLSHALRQSIGTDLDTFLALAQPEDPDRRAWAALVEQSTAAAATARSALARLEQPTPLSALELAQLQEQRDRLALLAPDEEQLFMASERLAAEATEHSRHRARVAIFEQRNEPDPQIRVAAQESLAWLEQRAAISPDAARLARARLARIDAELSSLASRLAVLDAPRSVPADTSAALARFESLAGFQDPRAVAWRERLSRIQNLVNRLEPLGRKAPLPPNAERDLTELCGLVGGDDPQVVAWTAKLTLIREYRASLSALDAQEPAPEAASAILMRLCELVGGDEVEVQRWQKRLETEKRLREELRGWEALFVLSGDALKAARGTLAEWRKLVGDEETGRRAAQRLAHLAGPPPASWASAHGHDHYGPWTELTVGGIRQRLRWLPPILAPIGSGPDQAGRDEDEARVMVRLTTGRWVADSECAQNLWHAVMGSTPARNRGPHHPVEQISAHSAAAFCARLAQMLPGCKARLPWEAEWEIAARAGSDGPWGAWPADQAIRTVVHAGSRSPVAVDEGLANALGLRHVAGNVGEWCADRYAPLPAGDPVVDPTATGTGQRVVKGGSWGDDLEHCRLANRTAVEPTRRSPCLGFRFVVDASVEE